MPVSDLSRQKTPAATPLRRFVAGTPAPLLVTAILLSVAIGLLTRYVAQPFLPPVSQGREIVLTSEITVAAILIPGVVHELIASTLFLLSALFLGWASGGEFMALQASSGGNGGASLTHRRGRIRLGLGDRPMGPIPMMLGLMLVVIAYAGLISQVQYRNTDDFFGSVFRAGFGWRLIAFLVVGLLAPVAEEMLFRGWLWTALRRSWPALTCSLVTAVLWAATHAPEGAPKVAIIMPVGLLLGFARSRSASLRAPILLHLAFNLGSLTAPFILYALSAR